MPTLTWPYVHLLINHFPVVLTVVALVAALAAMVSGRRALWLNAMAMLTAAGVVVYPVHFTGDQADHALRDPWYIKGGAIDAHDNAAGIALVIILVAGVIGAYGWWRALKRRDEIIPGWIRAGVLIGALAVSARSRGPRISAARSSTMRRCSVCRRRQRGSRRESRRRRMRIAVRSNELTAQLR